MSYEIDVASVTAVLLADGWHRVKGKSFGIEPYGYVAVVAAEAKAEEKAAGKGNAKKDGRANGKKKANGIPAVAEKGLAPVLGARWTKPNGEVIACPVASVLALRHAHAMRA